MVNYIPLSGTSSGMYYIYILKSLKNGRYYIGQTYDIPKRLLRHNKGEIVSTKKNIPYELIYSETCATRSEVMRRKKEIKAYKGGNSFKTLLGKE